MPSTPTSGRTLERYDKTLFLVLTTVKLRPNTWSVSLAREIVETGEIMILRRSRFRGQGPPWRPQRAGRRAPARGSITCAAVKLGPYAVMHAIADHVVDSYLDVTDLVESDVDTIEEDLFSPLSQTNIECIYLLSARSSSFGVLSTR